MASKKIFREFKAARAFVHSQNLKNYKQWREWAQSLNRPQDIPSNPRHAYANQGWLSWGDLLGTGVIATRHRVYRTFTEAREYMHNRKLKSRTEWDKFLQANLLPKDIPVHPDRTYKHKGWIGWGDFLGTGTIAFKNRILRPFEKARDFARSLNLKNQAGWYAYAKTDAHPIDIPAYPNEAYAGKGWISWGDWLGTGRIASQNIQYRFFEGARNFVRSLGLKNNKAWREWSKSGARPIDIPTSPDKVYANQGWISWGDFLGTGAVFKKTFRVFEKARDFARTLNFQSRTDWEAWLVTGDRPNDIPSNPSKAYANEGWKGWGDFLGTGNVAQFKKIFRPFEQARIFARSLSLKGKEDWARWTKTNECPDDIPSAPDRTYANKGWINWSDWLGCDVKWNISEVRMFIHSLLPYLDTFEPAELYAIYQQNGLLESTGKSRAFIKNFISGKFPKQELQDILNDPLKFAEFIESQNDLLTEEDTELQTIIESDFVTQAKDLPIIETKDILAAIDAKIIASADVETIDFLIKSTVAKIWRHAFNDEKKAQLQLERYKTEGEYANEVKKLFSEGYEGAKSLQMPRGYNLNPPVFLPKQEELGLMQRYVAYQIKTRKRFGNWSGTGAGKTLSAILASRVIDAKLTVVCCPNNVIDTWKKQLQGSYPDSVIYTKESMLRLSNKDNLHKYLILNYEFFQQPDSKDKLKWLIEYCNVDLIVVDEIHYSKQRRPNKASKRKILISEFLSEASNKNQSISILGMSATPVINELFEGKTLIELITGVYHDELDTRPTISNCIALYKKFISNGIRYIPNYNIQFDEPRKINIDCSGLMPEIRRHKSNFELEVILTKAKISFILEELQPKTIIYTHYLEGIDLVLQDAIRQKGWKVALFTGEQKDGLEQFVNGNADVLIASSCIATGVDGLQKVCNRLIINCLPWTHAEYKQLIGRIYRQGQIKSKIDIIIPLTFADINGEHWSWCESRWQRIEFKKGMADAAVDGQIPEGQLRNPAQAHKDIMQWFDRLDKKGIHEFERSKISLQLTGDTQQIALRKMSDISKLNQQINKETSQNTHQRFTNNPQEWDEYHEAYREVRQDWEVIPYQEAIKWCKARPHLIIGDFGCGEAFLAAELNNKVYSFDHVAINENVIVCDISHVSLNDASLDAAIFSLSLMGINFIDYLREAKRCLKLDGHLWIAEPTSRIKDINIFKELLELIGFDVRRSEFKGKFTFIEALKSEREVNEVVLENINYKNYLD